MSDATSAKPRTFTSRKRKNEQPLSGNLNTKRTRRWEQLQTGFDAAKLKINRAFRQSKKRALDKVRQSHEYKTKSTAERAVAEASIVTVEERKRDEKLVMAAREWKQMTYIGEEANFDSMDSTPQGETLDWESPDENEPDVSDPEFEAPDSIAAAEGVPHDYDAQGKPQVSDE